ncbi:MAG: hypothetical protein ACOX2F_05890 [bacterium]
MSRIEFVLREIQQLIEFYDKTKELREKIREKSKEKGGYVVQDKLYGEVSEKCEDE